jgi:hypothetical protein
MAQGGAWSWPARVSARMAAADRRERRLRVLAASCTAYVDA